MYLTRVLFRQRILLSVFVAFNPWIRCCFCFWLDFGQKTYRIFQNGRSHNDARTHCQNFGGDLAIIRSNSVQQQISSRLRTLASSVSHRGLYRFGLHEDTTDGTWYWVDGTELISQVSNWYTNEPNNAGRNEDCAVVQERLGKWFDIRCDLPLPFICEKSKNQF